MFVAVGMIAVFAPYEAAFDVRVFPHWMDQLIYIMFVVDFGVNFVISFRDGSGRYVLERNLVARRYIFSFAFIVDSVSILPIALLEEWGALRPRPDREERSRVNVDARPILVPRFFSFYPSE